MNGSREMTLEEVVGRLYPKHTARLEYEDLVGQAADTEKLRAEIERLEAELARLRRDRDDCLAAREHYAGLFGEHSGRAERMEAALRNARDYVETALAEERIKFKGYENCSGIQQMERDIASIDAALNAQPGEAQ